MREETGPQPQKEEAEAVPREEEKEESIPEENSRRNMSLVWGSMKVLVAAGFLYASMVRLTTPKTALPADTRDSSVSHVTEERRRLQAITTTPSYMEPMMKDLRDRKKLFEETPPEEIKYWFEYTGPLQKYFYRFSKSRGKADYFEGRDDSGVVSARFIDDAGGTKEYRDMFLPHQASDGKKDANEKKAMIPDDQAAVRSRLLENCLAMGSSTRPRTGVGSVWRQWFGKNGAEDRCRILFALNTVGAGRGTNMLWETEPPELHAEGPLPWISEQATAATHLERNLKEINAMCETGLIAARVQILVCEPIESRWIEWMDSQLVACGGKPWPMDRKFDTSVKLEDRPSPVQVVVTASAQSAPNCHDLKSGFMERRMQDMVLAPPPNGQDTFLKDLTGGKSTDASLVSSDDHDLYVAMKWSSLVTLRSVNSFLQASADIAAAASAPTKQRPDEDSTANHPASPFLVPSFVRVSYVSEENSKIAKWRMHGDFFHPAAWEICRDSFEVTWIPDSLSGSGGVQSICRPATEGGVQAPRKLVQQDGKECGQWWIYMTELQMPTNPEVYADEAVPPPIQGGSNSLYMVTERQRAELAKGLTCRRDKKQTVCPELPQAVIPLGDVESFLINYSPNTALGKKHLKGRRPGYSKAEEHEQARERVREREQLREQDEIENALFDYTVYPAALFRKDATLKAARSRDAALTDASQSDSKAVGPRTVKSSYFDITITKPRPPVLGWCQAMARLGLCTLYADYFRTSEDERCMEACGLKKNFTPVDVQAE